MSLLVTHMYGPADYGPADYGPAVRHKRINARVDTAVVVLQRSNQRPDTLM